MSNPDSPLSKPLRPEDPQRLQAFRARIESLRWDAADVTPSMSHLFSAVDDLAQSEVAYYYRRRSTRAWISGLTRIGAWSLGSVGLLLPLLAAADAPRFAAWGLYGYAFLAAAASCLAANSLFGGTEGHIRFVTTQLQLEKLITASRIRWCQYLSQPHATQAQIDNGFALVLQYAGELHGISIGETGHWGETLLTELAQYQKKIEARGAETKR
ncbi:hypothetical protein SAMN04488038_105101 [Solimonas aquatica]|uniref:SMODS and SLOG-associating 2TM effector domain-containing protein n=1 Tax=Solimonas aquatica TaxID=489703 RepID=A0A1H9EQI2_9GAMM|nr:SLATT domain-containing protein [Solimonas aquatica]SEQ27258.1 hypothetical protein SAMN04488038_105101 [Solimonas aquatica]